MWMMPLHLHVNQKSDYDIYLRNHLTHTVNNLLQTLNNVKSIQFFVVKHKFNVIHIVCENFKQIPWILFKLQLILFERVKIGSHKYWNLGSNLHFSEAILISFVMLNNGKRHFVIKMHDIHSGLGVRHNNDLDRKFPLVGHRQVFVFGWAHCGSTGKGFILALTVCEFRAIFFVSSQ